jgi:uncharacterized protein YbjT (DUF2867 family)
MRIFVTGASGYVGRYLVRAATGAGHHVIAGSRTRALDASDWIPYDFASPVKLPLGVTHVVHLAADTSGKEGGEAIEVRAAIDLARATVDAGAVFLFVSSQSAQPNAPSTYGRKKWTIEQAVISMGCLVVRPGQVFGGREEGLFGKLVRGLRRFRIMPWLLPSPKVQPIHVEDCASGIIRMLEHGVPSERPLVLASAPVTFNAMLQSMAHARVRGLTWIVPVPVMPIRLVSSLAGWLLGDRSPLGRVQSLFAIPLADTAPDLAGLGIELRSLEDGMSRSGGHRRRLLCEAAAFHRYLMKAPATSGFSRTYVRVIEALRGGACLGLPQAFIACPGLIAAIDVNGYDELRWRLDAATTMAEASPAGYKRFNGVAGPWPWTRAALALVAAVAGECLARLGRPLVQVIWRLPKSASGAPGS